MRSDPCPQPWPTGGPVTLLEGEWILGSCITRWHGWWKVCFDQSLWRVRRGITHVLLAGKIFFLFQAENLFLVYFQNKERAAFVKLEILLDHFHSQIHEATIKFSLVTFWSKAIDSCFRGHAILLPNCMVWAKLLVLYAIGRFLGGGAFLKRSWFDIQMDQIFHQFDPAIAPSPLLAPAGRKTIFAVTCKLATRLLMVLGIWEFFRVVFLIRPESNESKPILPCSSLRSDQLMALCLGCWCNVVKLATDGYFTHAAWQIDHLDTSCCLTGIEIPYLCFPAHSLRFQGWTLTWSMGDEQVAGTIEFYVNANKAEEGSCSVPQIVSVRCWQHLQGARCLTRSVVARQVAYVSPRTFCFVSPSPSLCPSSLIYQTLLFSWPQNLWHRWWEARFAHLWACHRQYCDTECHTSWCMCAHTGLIILTPQAIVYHSIEISLNRNNLQFRWMKSFWRWKHHRSSNAYFLFVPPAFVH